MARTLLTLAVVVLLLTVPVGSAAALSVPGLDDGPSLAIQRYGADADPSFIVHVDNDSMTSLSNWADTSDDRRILSEINETSAVVAAPGWQVDQGILARIGSIDLSIEGITSIPDIINPTQLQDLGYVRSLEPNYVRSYAEPVDDLGAASAFARPQLGTFGFDDPAFPTEGVAFAEDANRTDMGEGRAIVGADAVPRQGEDIVVAPIDTGTNVAGGSLYGNHSTSEPTRIHNASRSFISDETVDVAAGDYSAIEDGNDHGSWVSSSIAANSTIGTDNRTMDGVAPRAELLVLRALDDGGSGSTANIVEAIRYAADHDADVISMSLGSPLYSQALDDAVTYARDQGSVVVVAAGNSRQTVRWLASPADSDAALAVAATNGSEAGNAWAASFSQVGPDPGTTDLSTAATAGARVDVAAPGMETAAPVASTGGFVRNRTLSGTSMATPYAAAAIALGIEANPGWNATEAMDAARESARPIPHAASTEVGHGMIAADHLVDGTRPAENQTDVMTDPAATRDAYHESASAASGGLLAGLFDAIFG